MNDFDKLLEIAQFLGLDSVVDDLLKIHAQETQENADLMLALVGEFSAGKTSLINSLTNSKALETATVPTTATIYDIHFCSSSNKAVVYDNDGSSREIEDLSTLKNESLKDAKIVSLYDTSCKVPATTVLVDTPGLSSPDSKHKEVLCKFLPNADAILLVVDINQQVTRSLTDFVKTVKLAKKKLFLVVTKCDTKDESQKRIALQYIAKNCDLPLEYCACVSAKTGNISEFLEVLDVISRDKKNIIADISKARYEAIAEKLKSDLIKLSNIPQDDEDIQKNIQQTRSELNKIQREIDEILVDAQVNIDCSMNDACREFENRIFDQLDAIAGENGLDFDKEIQAKINGFSTIVFNNLKDEVGSAIQNVIAERRKNGRLILQNTGALDFSSHTMSQLSYGLKLNEMGHKFDKAISTGVKTVAAAAAVYFAGPAILETVEIAGPELLTAGGELGAAAAIDTVDAITDVGSIIAAKKTIDSNKNVVESNRNRYECLPESNAQQVQPQEKKDTLTNIIGFVSDRTVGKPQRRKAIHAYLDDELMPQFKHQVKSFVNKVLSQIRAALNKDAEQDVNDLTESLEKLRDKVKNGQAAYEAHIQQIKTYIRQLG